MLRVNQQEYAANKNKAIYDYGREMRGTGVVKYV
jgi:hypothetical protein